MNNDEYRYSIDGENRIVSVSDNWDAFARANNGASSIQSDDIIGKKVWSFFAGEEIKYLFRQLFEYVRNKQKVIIIPFRCDSPVEQRFLELRLEPLEDQGLKFTNSIIKVEKCQSKPESLFDVDADNGVLKVCSMCKKLEVSDGQWLDMEQGIPVLNLFGEQAVPPISHGLCKPCYHQALIELRLTRKKNRRRYSSEQVENIHVS